MPRDRSSTAPDRAELRSRLLVAQFWVGIGLAPIAALLLIFGGTTAAAVLAIIAVVVLALSVMLRSDPTSMSVSASGPRDVTVDDMNALRDDVRADITTAARATHRALSERMSRLEESVAGVHRLDESLIGMRRLEESIAGVQRQVEAARAVAIDAREAVDNRRELPLPPPRRPAAVVGSVPGVVRHTETVVTRSMYVDQPSDDVDPVRPSGSTVYGSASRSASRSPAGRAAIDGVVSGSSTYGSDGRRLERIADRGDDPTDSSGDLADDARWSQMRDGDRWAEVRADDQGRELRMAERREERRVDETGTQLRIVDRWSTVRDERLPQSSDRSAVRETRAERRRRAEAEAEAEADRYGPARPALPRPRQATDVHPERLDDNGRGWRDVRSGVVEPDHSDGYGAPDYAQSVRDHSAYDQRLREKPMYDAPDYEASSHNDVGIYRRSTGERPASRPPAPVDVWADERYARRPTNGAAGRRDSGDFPAARRDSGEFPPVRRPEPPAYDDGTDRGDRWVQEPGRQSTGRRPRLEFEPTDDRWR